MGPAAVHAPPAQQSEGLAAARGVEGLSCIGREGTSLQHVPTTESDMAGQCHIITLLWPPHTLWWWWWWRVGGGVRVWCTSTMYLRPSWCASHVCCWRWVPYGYQLAVVCVARRVPQQLQRAAPAEVMFFVAGAGTCNAVYTTPGALPAASCQWLCWLRLGVAVDPCAHLLPDLGCVLSSRWLYGLRAVHYVWAG
jgi:hypothetical protein